MKRFVPLPRFLVRAPLLPLPPFGASAGRRLMASPLGRLALQLASPSLAARPEGPRAARALGRYGRRASFRATPHGLLAGVTFGELGARSRATTGRPRPHLDLGWGRVAALGRALLDDPDVRPQVRLRHAPSLLRGPDRVRWMSLGTGGHRAEEHEAELDARLERVLDASSEWVSWSVLRRAVEGDGADGGGADADADADADELLLLLVDDGLLHHDLAPALVGPPAAAWMSERLGRLQPHPPALETLARVRRALAEADLAAARAALRALPGAPPDTAESDGDGGDVAAVLVHRPAGRLTLDRKIVQRAADLAPLLFRLQQALTPPAGERLAARAAREAVRAAGELFGDGALDLRGLALGEYGVDPSGRHDAADDDNGEDDGSDGGAANGDVEPAGQAATLPAALLRLLVDEIAAARAGGRDEIALAPEELDAALPATEPPPSFELFLSPRRAPRGARAAGGAGWLLGLHAPAGATWGRFAAAVGAPLVQALDDLAAAERAAEPGVRFLDVAYAPSPALADLCAHPAVRDGVLALSGWPAGSSAALVPADLELHAEGGEAVALRARFPAGAVVPSPLWRVRSHTAPGGVQRLLAGWSLYRQHAPWALSLGPLAGLAHVPRISIGGFVVSPASWRLPAGLAPGAPGRRLLARWRREARVPRVVQVGDEDELLPVDLDDPGALDDLAGRARAWEIWPPATRRETIDSDGRRLECVVAVVAAPAQDAGATAAGSIAAAPAVESVPPPRLQPAAPGWLTFKLFAVEDRQDDLLLQAVAPAARAGLASGEIDRWFFIRYVDGPGLRPHLRLRVHAAQAAQRTAFAARLDAALAAPRAAGAVAMIETAAYHPESARFGGATGGMAAAEAIFQSDSQLACELLAAMRDAADASLAPDVVDLCVMAFDALADGLDLDRVARHQLARGRRAASAAALPDRDAADAELRARARPLREALAARDDDTDVGAGDGNDVDDNVARALRAHRQRVARATAALPPEARATLLPSLLHLSAVRLAGAQPGVEARAYLFWERTLEGLLRSPPVGKTPSRRGDGLARGRDREPS